MRRLSLILLLLIPIILMAQDYPHGDDFTISCEDCHTAEGWKYAANAVFNHDKTNFRLEGQHTVVNCRQCHTSLVFSEAKSNCSACHADLHNTTVGNDCSRCHTPKSWIVTNITELHQRSRFPLLGAHNTADCSACHTSVSNLEFQPLGIACYDCHKTNYESTTNPNHRLSGLSTDCVQCHRIDAFEWSSTGFNHDFFPLTAGHQINDCAACHKSNIIEPLSPECYSCHQADFANTTNPKHKQPDFSTVCTQCHTTRPDWKPARFDIHDAGYFPIYSGEHKGEWESCADCHKQSDNYSSFSCTDCHEHNRSKMDDEHKGINGYSYNSIACYGCHPKGSEDGAFNHSVTGFELKGAHIQTDCADCHQNGYSGTSPLCNSCHSSDFQQAANPNHTNAGISSECKNCHTENAWKPSLFDHIISSGFALTGGHSGRQCSDCHIGNTTSATSACYSCHNANYNQAPNHLAQKFPTQCEQCHNSNIWGETVFNHNNTAFPLTGAHVATECAACHTAGYAGTPTLCNACHTKNYNEAQNPSHTTAGISNTCETCHNTANWIPSLFNHSNTTGFALTGGHSGRQCSDCHIGNTTSATSACYSCHNANYNQAPNHLAQKYPIQCEQCHNSNSWGETVFNHNNTAFPLTGAHVATECAACHTAGYAGTPTLCNACHTKNYNEAQNPSHTAAGISNTCETCHNTANWIPSLFNHSNTTGFALTGGHSGRQCSDCHIGNTTSATSACYSCHQANYNQAPNHLAQKFPTQCEQCHNSNSWGETVFNHNNTAFPLTGAHVATECAACHTAGYAGTPTLCNACHIKNYNEAQNPSHTAAGISNTCETCHNTANWIPSLFNHSNTTGFALTGGHSGRQCSDCHIGNTTSATSACYSCHNANYNQAPNHLAQKFPTQCEQCHNSNSWGETVFNHNNTAFPLTGAHVATECAACHTAGYAGTPTLCNACHTNDYNKTTNPVHSSIGISTSCNECHTTNPGWQPATFPIHQNFFVFKGAHQTVATNCFLCHAGNYINTPNTCYGCHTSDYNGTANPAHKTASFPTTCENCHTESAWTPSTFNHDGQYFPIYSGEHKGEWNNCADCHTQPTNYAVFSCTNCHEHNKTEMDSEHREVGGYVYNSVNCLSCHPKGDS